MLALSGVGADSPRWAPQRSGSTARLRGVAAVDDRTAWATGTGGAVVRTVDGGATWRPASLPGADGLDVRDVHAVDDRRAVALSIGPGPKSRILLTGDAGASWEARHVGREERDFLDAVAFADDRRGWALGDPVDGRFALLATLDGGRSWAGVDGSARPAALDGEAAFAASGTCLVALDGDHLWVATGGAATARVHRSVDGGRSWTATPCPIRAGNASSGVFSVAFRDPDHGVAVGGDYKAPESPGVAARTSDGGRTWAAPTGRPPGGYRSAVAYVPGRPTPTLVAVGPTGADLSVDDGETWTPLGEPGHHAVSFAPRAGLGWAVGESGRIARIDFGP